MQDSYREQARSHNGSVKIQLPVALSPVGGKSAKGISIS
jgi:hypothetical protein